MELVEIAVFRSGFGSKFGIPRQSGLAASLTGRVELRRDLRSEAALRGLDGFSHVWLIWGFSANPHAPKGLTVRPPRLGGNVRMGVFATRSPFRPNPIGLSLVEIEQIRTEADKGPVIFVKGADLMDGTPVYDIKPYLPYTDCRPDARAGFAEEDPADALLEVNIPDTLAAAFSASEGQTALKALEEVLALDPRPAVQAARTKEYAFPFYGRDVRFRVEGKRLTVLDITKI